MAFAFHPVTVVSLLFSSEVGALDGLRGNALILACFVGVNEGALAGAGAALIAFTLRHSVVQGTALLVPVLMWGASSLLKARGRGIRAILRWEIFLLGVVLALEGLPTSWDLRSALLNPSLVNPTSRSPELTPHWYLLSSTFISTLPYFSYMVWALPLLLPIPVTWRLRRLPDAATIVSLSFAALLDPSQGASLLRLPLLLSLGVNCRNGRISRGMGHGKVLFWMGLLHASILAAPVMKHLWLRSGGVGNINFLLWQQLLATLSGASLIAEFARSSVETLDATSKN